MKKFLIALFLVISLGVGTYAYVAVNDTTSNEKTTDTYKSENTINKSEGSGQKANIPDTSPEVETTEVNSYSECVAAGYTTYSPIEGPAFCKSPNGKEFYDN